MLYLPDYFYTLNIFSIGLRLILAMLMGGIIGMERGTGHHAAGFRTHILVCMGATLTMLTNEYMVTVLGMGSDPARMGAQVITGVGFLGVGTILITGRKKIRGLTTAAGLWASACLGLAIGIGFYEGALLGALLIFVSLALLPKIENAIYQSSGNLNLYIEVKHFKDFLEVVNLAKDGNTRVCETEFNQGSTVTPEGISFSIWIKLDKKESKEKIVNEISDIEGVTIIEEI